jgi:predicted acyltransferase
MNARPSSDGASKISTPNAASPQKPAAEPESSAPAVASTGRVVAIDALRGFDMFWIVGGHGLVLSLVAMFWNPAPEWLTTQMKHVPWEGFSAWDLIMPLFLFVVGASMPFSFAKRIEHGTTRGAMYRKVFTRVVILWILGMIAQGRLLDFDIHKLRLYSNTLQSIAAGYLVASLVLIHFPLWLHPVVTGGLLAGFWTLMTYVSVPGYGAGQLQEHANLARWVDDFVLRSAGDGSTYTWIVSSLGFAATVLLGVHAGQLLRSRWSGWAKFGWLLAAAAACLVGGWVWSYRFPIIKHLWTSSMVLWAGGWSFLLLAVFYLLTDLLGWRRWAFPFIVIGSNAIFAYMATHPYNLFGDMAGKLVNGLAVQLSHVSPAGSNLLRAAAGFALLWGVLYYMYRNKTFLRV